MIKIKCDKGRCIINRWGVVGSRATPQPSSDYHWNRFKSHLLRGENRIEHWTSLSFSLKYNGAWYLPFISIRNRKGRWQQATNGWCQIFTPNSLGIDVHNLLVARCGKAWVSQVNKMITTLELKVETSNFMIKSTKNKQQI